MILIDKRYCNSYAYIALDYYSTLIALIVAISSAPSNLAPFSKCSGMQWISEAESLLSDKYEFKGIRLLFHFKLCA